ncbi:MAG: DNA primase [Planctomycetota bacterium]|jgi:DNA primase
MRNARRSDPFEPFGRSRPLAWGSVRCRNPDAHFLSTNPELQRAIEAIKLRAPIEDVVRERVPSLKRKGQRWWACCPFHDEDTPSFSVNPQLGIWHCFGACSTGGDQISFLQRLDGLHFMDAVEILAARSGVELPRRRSARQVEGEDRGLAALARADELFQEMLRKPEGRGVRAYLAERGIGDNTIAAFGIGFAPNGGLLSNGVGRGNGAQAFLETGLIRRSDRGDTYDFFRGRLMIPIRDAKGRTVGFGARRLADDESSAARGPKYVNTPETPWFHKGRLIYGMDRAIDDIRRNGHAILVEGYTDVMAAHQVGIANVVAVLGTSTTEDHGRLLRRAGARRISLLFDGDEAGRKACMKALQGLLPLEAEIDVIRLPADSDPCDLLIREGAQALLAQVEMAEDWFAFLLSGFKDLRGAELSRAVDQVLGLLGYLSKPVHRESLVSELAAHLGFPVTSLRAQMASLPGRAHERRQVPQNQEAQQQGGAGQPNRGAPAAAGETGGSAGQAESETSTTPNIVKAPRRIPILPRDPAFAIPFRDLIGAVLVDPSLIPLARPWAEECPFEDLACVLFALLELYEDPEMEIGIGRVLTHLQDSPACHCVAPIAEHASRADNPRALIDGAILSLTDSTRRVQSNRIASRLNELSPAIEHGDPAAAEEAKNLTQQLTALQRPPLQPSPT